MALSVTTKNVVTCRSLASAALTDSKTAIEREWETRRGKPTRLSSADTVEMMHHSFLTPYAELNLLSYSRVNTAHSQIRNTQRDSRETDGRLSLTASQQADTSERKDHIWSQSPVMMLETLARLSIYASYCWVISWKMQTSKEKRVAAPPELLKCSSRPTTHRVRLLEGKWNEPEGECDLAQISSAHLSGGKIASVSKPLAPHKKIWRGENEILFHVYSPSCQTKPVIDFPLWTIKTVCNKNGWWSALKQTK